MLNLLPLRIRKYSKGEDNIFITSNKNEPEPEPCRTCLKKVQEGCVYPNTDTRGQSKTQDCSSIFGGTLDFSEEQKRELEHQSKMLRRAAPKPDSSIKFRKWRKRNGIKQCNSCGKRLTTEAHHMLCNKCWNNKQAQRRQGGAV